MEDGSRKALKGQGFLLPEGRKKRKKRQADPGQSPEIHRKLWQRSLKESRNFGRKAGEFRVEVGHLYPAVCKKEGPMSLETGELAGKTSPNLWVFHGNPQHMNQVFHRCPGKRRLFSTEIHRPAGGFPLPSTGSQEAFPQTLGPLPQGKDGRLLRA